MDKRRGEERMDFANTLLFMSGDKNVRSTVVPLLEEVIVAMFLFTLLEALQHRPL